MKNEGREARVTIAFTPEELEALDGWRFGRRIASRSEAIRQLIARGLTVPDEQPEASAPKAKRGRKGTP